MVSRVRNSGSTHLVLQLLEARQGGIDDPGLPALVLQGGDQVLAASKHSLHGRLHLPGFLDQRAQAVRLPGAGSAFMIVTGLPLLRCLGTGFLLSGLLVEGGLVPVP